MADISIGQYGWAADLVQTPSGDLQTVDGSALGTQRVIRRLLTPKRALLAHPEYGAGLPEKIGSTRNVRTITGIVRAQMYQEAAVAHSPQPAVEIQEIPAGSGEQIVNIKYQDAESGAPMLLTFNPAVGNSNGG
ncbi:MAG TPA: hypothetical protein VFA12_20080 [Stellaceae bacterium]|nr:hypothetical protein [Stellaceae bacterium]